ncbi:MULTISPECIES: hypothetical protein [unclassified Cedecea]|uniref:hypothetical protein n=1 Tax=unclassified Cedecea TaxID=2649846 RepID=UPI003019EE61
MRREKIENVKQWNVMKEKKTISVGVRLSPAQEEILKSLIACGKATTMSSAIQYLIQQYAILGK